MCDPHTTSVAKIMRLVANLPDARVEEVFQGVGRMPQITSCVLSRMAKVMSNMFEESRVAPVPSTRRSTRLKVLQTQPSSPHPSKRTTRSRTKFAKKPSDSESSFDGEETETEDEDSESEQEESADEVEAAAPPQRKAKVFA
jgi:hypothetical protein